MKKPVYKLLLQMAALFLLAAAAFLFSAFADSKTYTGTLGDAMCGAKHVMDGSANCTQVCVQHGSKYALIVNDKVYTLTSSDKTLLGQLNNLAGKIVSVKGTPHGDHGDMIEVVSIKQK